jgi:hypothetical protein
LNRISLFCRIVLALGLLISAGSVRCEILDSLEVTRRGNEAEITIRFTTTAQYLRHSPVDSGKILNINIQLLGIGSKASDLENLVQSVRHSPATDMVPPFKVTYPGANGLMLVEFEQSTRFAVRAGRDGRSVSIIVPVLPGAQDWMVESRASPVATAPAAPKQTAIDPPATLKPVEPPTDSPAPVLAARAEPAAAPVKSTPPPPSTPVAARAVPAIDLIDVQRRGKEAEINLHFTAAIHYSRHTSLDAGKLLRIYPRPGDGGAKGTKSEAQSVRLPENDMVPRFTASYPDADNALSIAFDQPTRFTVRQGADERSLIVIVPVLANAKDWSVQVRPATTLADAPLIAPPIATPSAPAIVPAPVTAPPQATARQATSIAQAAPQPTRPSAEEVAPPQVTPRASGRTVPAPVNPSALPEPVAVPATEAIIPAPATTSSPAATAQNLPALAPLSKDEIESRAKEWMEAAREAIARRNGVNAAARLNQVLSLPPNSQTEAANALMGEAREFSGELRRAVAEYESYLKNYPNGAFTPHVKERLAAINKIVASANVAAAGQGLKPGTGPASWSINGGISQYYYTGNSKIETLTPPPPGQLLFNRDTLSLTDQKSLISNLDFSARRRDAATDTRIVVRETDNRNYLQGQPSYDRLYAAYVEQTNKEVGYFVRAGRQTGQGGGVLGRFDGLSLGYNINPSWRVNAVAGNPAEFRDPFRRSVYGTSVEYIPQLGRPGISAYVVQQSLEGAKDRQAVGSEVRYFDQNVTVFSLLDYDTYYKAVNIAMMQGNLRTAGGTNYFANIDIRRSPPLSLTTALPGQISQDPFQPTLDFRSLFQSSLNTLGLDQLRDQASLLSPTSSFYTLGFIHPVTQRWQLGADYRQSNISDTGASGILPAQPGSGTSHVVSGQALGNSLLLSNDSFVLNSSFIFAPLYTGQNYNLAYIVPVKDWRFDMLLGYYYQTDTQGQRQTRLTPTARVVYRIKRQLTLEIDAGSEIFDEVGPLREQHSRRTYLYGGYRWDFN